MKVCLEDGGGRRRPIGCAAVPDAGGPSYTARRIGAGWAAAARFAVGTVTRLPEGGGGGPVAERAIPAAPGQPVELQPGWEPLAS